MKKIISMIVFFAVVGIMPVMTSCQGLVDAVLGTDDNPSTTPTVSHISGISITADGIENGELKINAGLKQQLTATITPPETQETSVNWKSSDESVLTVTTTGEISAIKDGTAIVTVTSAVDATKSATLTVLIIDNKLNINNEPIDQMNSDARG